MKINKMLLGKVVVGVVGTGTVVSVPIFVTKAIKANHKENDKQIKKEQGDSKINLVLEGSKGTFTGSTHIMGSVDTITGNSEVIQVTANSLGTISGSENQPVIITTEPQETIYGNSQLVLSTQNTMISGRTLIEPVPSKEPQAIPGLKNDPHAKYVAYTR